MLDDYFKTLVQDAVKQVLAEKGNPDDERWVSPAEAAEIIGGHSRDEIVELVKDGLVNGHQRQPGLAKSHWRIWLPSLKEYSRALAYARNK